MYQKYNYESLTYTYIYVLPNPASKRNVALWCIFPHVSSEISMLPSTLFPLLAIADASLASPRADAWIFPLGNSPFLTSGLINSLRANENNINITHTTISL